VDGECNSPPKLAPAHSTPSIYCGECRSVSVCTPGWLHRATPFPLFVTSYCLSGCKGKSSTGFVAGGILLAFIAYLVKSPVQCCAIPKCRFVLYWHIKRVNVWVMLLMRSETCHGIRRERGLGKITHNRPKPQVRISATWATTGQTQRSETLLRLLATRSLTRPAFSHFSHISAQLCIGLWAKRRTIAP
jgi:hypothetical protein